jgi:hypothetical protein
MCIGGAIGLVRGSRAGGSRSGRAGQGSPDPTDLQHGNDPHRRSPQLTILSGCGSPRQRCSMPHHLRHSSGHALHLPRDHYHYPVVPCLSHIQPSQTFTKNRDRCDPSFPQTTRHPQSTRSARPLGTKPSLNRGRTGWIARVEAQSTEPFTNRRKDKAARPVFYTLSRLLTEHAFTGIFGLTQTPSP